MSHALEMSKRNVSSPNENIAPGGMIMDQDFASTPAKKSRIDFLEGKIVVAGRVSSVRLINFMCHANLQIDFDTKANNCFYIGGPNGSGKSALFAAINLGLGGRGSDNDRGNTVKSYIKDGNTQSKITITLTNEGLNSHPDLDQLISVERTINQTSSTYVMKSIKVTSSGYVERVISNKKSDIDRIISRFNIHLSNPAFWMSQDRSRSFLSNFKPSSVYKLYLESTNLENIRLSYVRFAAALDDCFALVSQKADEIANERRKLKRMQEQRELQIKLDTDRAMVASYRWKLLFCRVRDYEDEIQLNLKKQEVQKKLREECKAEYAKNRAERTEVEKKIQKFSDEVEIQDEEVNEAKENLNEKTRIVYELEEQSKSYGLQVKRKWAEIKNIKKTIAQAQDEVRSLLEKKGNQKLTRELTEVENHYNKISIERENMEIGCDSEKLKDKLEMATIEFKKKEDEKYEKQREISKLRRKVEQDQDMMRRSSAMKKNAINKYGSHMAEILAEVNRCESQFQNLPKGPIGKYITLTDDKWEYPVEECLHNIANNFLCASGKDAGILRGIFKRLQIPPKEQPSIIVSRPTGTCYPNLKEPSSEFITVLRSIKFSDPDVHNVVIDKSNCEQFILLESKTKAMELMGSNHPPRNVVKAYTLDGSQAYANGPTSQYRFYSGRGGRASGIFGSEQAEVDVAALIREIDEAKAQIVQLEFHDLKNYEIALKELSRERNLAKSAIEEFDKKLGMLRSQELKATRRINDLKAELAQSANEDLIENLNESIEEMQKKIPAIEQEIHVLEEKAEQLAREIEPAVKEKNDAKKILIDMQDEIRDFSCRTTKLQRELSKFDDVGEILKSRLDKLKADEGVLYHDEARLKSERDDAELMVQQDKKTQPMPPGESDPPDLSDFPTTDNAKKKIEELQKHVDRAALECDTTITLESVKEFKEKMKRRKYHCNSINVVLERLREVHDARLKNYPSLKKYTEMKVCDKFQELLEVRGHFIGGLEFDHDHETLNVNVQSCEEKDPMAGKGQDVNEQEAEQGSREEEETEDEESDDDGVPRNKKCKKQKPTKKKKIRDLKGLSGGERSFVTAALVMSLWEVMEQPFRMMDEFDVFMDMMNRKLVMDLLVEMATRKFPHNQFIFFTPQGIKELKMVDGLQVFEMNKVRD